MVIFLLLLSPVLAIAQVVTGKVVLFDDKEALPGVNVSILIKYETNVACHLLSSAISLPQDF